MAKFNSKSFNANAFGKYIETVEKEKKNELVGSGVLRSNSQIKNAFSGQSGVVYATLPMYARIGGTACAAMNAANEAAVARYLRDEIGFYDIPAAVERALTLPVMQNPTLDDILAIDAEARRIAAAL